MYGLPTEHIYEIGLTLSEIKMTSLHHNLFGNKQRTSLSLYKGLFSGVLKHVYGNVSQIGIFREAT